MRGRRERNLAGRGLAALRALLVFALALASATPSWAAVERDASGRVVVVFCQREALLEAAIAAARAERLAPAGLHDHHASHHDGLAQSHAAHGSDPHDPMAMSDCTVCHLGSGMRTFTAPDAPVVDAAPDVAVFAAPAIEPASVPRAAAILADNPARAPPLSA